MTVSSLFGIDTDGHGDRPVADELLSVESVEVSYGPIRALYGISLSVGSGETVALIGPNGAGKTSLLHAIIGLQPPSEGRVPLAGGGTSPGWPPSSGFAWASPWYPSIAGS